MNFSTKAQLISEAEALLDRCDAEDRPMTDSEQQKYDSLVRRAELKIAAGPDGQRRVPAQGFHADTLPASMSLPVGSSEPAANEPHFTAPFIAPAGSRRAFATNKVGAQAAYDVGQWLRASVLGNPQAADYCRQHGVGIRSALAGGVATAGGVLVPDELSAAIINLQEQYGLFRRASRVVPMSSDTLNIPRKTGGLVAYYVGENTAGTESDTTWDNVSLVAKKLMILTRMSSEINEDAVIDLANTLAMECALAFSLAEDQAGFNGTGASTYGGIVGILTKAIDGNHGMAVVEAASTHDTLPEVDATDLINLMAAIPVYARMGAAWYCSPTAEAVVFDAIKVAGSGNSAADIAQAGVPRFLGYPINSSDTLPDNVTANYNDLPMLAFGNLSLCSTMGARRDIRIALSDQQYWEEDQIGLKATERYDINVHDLGSATVKSPLAVLIGTT